MKKVSVLLLIALIMMLLLPTQAFAASASFIISGPSTLATGETGTYTIKVTVDDAAAAQAELVYDSSFFELVSGNPRGVWDVAENTSGTYTLTTVQLKCIAGTGTTGALSLTDYKVSRLTGTNPPSEPVSCGGTSKNVSNPVPTPTATPTVAPTATPSPTPKPTATPIPTAAATSKPTVEPTETESTETTASESTPTTSETAEPSPSPLPTPEEDLDWPDVEDMLGNLASGGSLQVDMSGKPEMPVSVLVALKACNGALEIDFGDYTCRIDAKTLNDLPTGFSLLDLAVSMVRDENLSQAAGGADVYQLHFNFHGELPGLFTYTFKADASQPGDTLYLYYSYEQAGVIEGMQSAIVDQDGYVTFSFYHCSSYFVANHIVHGAMSNFVAQLPDPPAENASGIPVWVYIVCLIGVAVISVLGTMFAGRLAFFRNRP